MGVDTVTVTTTEPVTAKASMSAVTLEESRTGSAESGSVSTREDGLRAGSAVGRLSRVLLMLVACLVYPISAAGHPAELERIEILTRRIEAQPLDPRLYLDRGAAYSHDGEYALAMTDLRRAAQLGDPVFAAYELGLLHYRKGERTEARTQLDRFLTRFPNHAPALEQRARVLADLGDTQAAVADYERVFAVTRRPNPGSYLSAAKLFARDADVAPALAMLDRGMERLGVIPQLQQYAIELELLGGQSDRALERLERLSSVLGDGPEWNVQMAELLIRMGRVKQARRHLSSASKTLRDLRRTPARTELAKRIVAIEATLVSP